MIHSISNEPTQGLVVWIKRTHDGTSSKASCSLPPSITFGLNQPLPEKGVRMDVTARLQRIRGFKGGKKKASLKLSFAEQGN